jgi:uncharacterized Zn-finger protein
LICGGSTVAITINASGVNLDCQGKRIEGGHPVIEVNGSNNVVKNCNIPIGSIHLESGI